jgi:sugar (pentulose or hexulose) kinase
VITLGVDVGTTHTKALAFDALLGRPLGVEVAPTPSVRDADGDAHRPAEVLATVVSLLRRLAGSIDDPARVASICAASVGEEAVLLDAGGEAVGDAIAWFDPRGTEEAAAFAAGPGAHLPLSRRFPSDPSFSLFKLLWVRQHRRADLERARGWIDLGGYVLGGLGGAPAMDWSHASRAGAFDLVERRWDRGTIAAAGLDGLAFPRLVPSGTILGSITPGLADATGLPRDVAIVAGGHDHLCAAFAAGIRTTGELFLSAGTSEAHLALTTAPIEPGHAGDRVDQGCYVDGEAYYVHVNIPSGHVFRQWRSLLYEGDDDSLYAEVAAVPPGARGVRFDLHDDPRHGRLDGLPYTADRATLMCAVMEGLARRSGDIVRTLEEVTGSRYQVIVAAGHPARAGYWRQLRLRTYGRPIATVDEPESAALGAAILAARAIGGGEAARYVAPRTHWRPEAAWR